MGADNFIAFYGIRFVLAEDELEACEDRSDERMQRARKAKLDAYFGRLSDGEPYFLLLGMRLGTFGVEGRATERSLIPGLNS